MFSDNTRRKIITKSSRFTALSTIKEYDSEQKLSKAEFFSSSTLWDEVEAKDKFSYNFLRQFFFQAITAMVLSKSWRTIYSRQEKN